MLVVFGLLILALLAKDATPLGDRYILRPLDLQRGILGVPYCE